MPIIAKRAWEDIFEFNAIDIGTFVEILQVLNRLQQRFIVDWKESRRIFLSILYNFIGYLYLKNI